MLAFADLSRTFIGLGIVLALMVVVFWLARRIGPQAAGLGGGRERRLALLESLPLDPRTRLVLVRHDAREHLVMISSTGGATLVHSSGEPGLTRLDGRAA